LATAKQNRLLLSRSSANQPPSDIGCENSSFALDGLQLPPFKVWVFFPLLLQDSGRNERNERVHFLAWSDVAVFPCTNGPDGFVCYDDFSKSAGSNAPITCFN